MTEPHPQRCSYSRTLEEVGDFCIIKDDWVSESQCDQCPASHSASGPIVKGTLFTRKTPLWVTTETAKHREKGIGASEPATCPLWECEVADKSTPKCQECLSTHLHPTVQAREQVLDEIIEWRKKEMGQPWGYYDSWRYEARFLESLRKEEQKAMTGPNHKRCETCMNKREVQGTPDYSNLPPFGFTPFVRCLVNNEVVTRDEYQRICIRGCASHIDPGEPVTEGYLTPVYTIDYQHRRISQKLIYGKCIPDGDCAKCILCDNAGGCLAESSYQVREAVKQARKQVLEELRKLRDTLCQPEQKP